jgi:hypothetical protein
MRVQILPSWKGSNRKQSFKQQQLMLGTGTAIWWVTEPHCLVMLLQQKSVFYTNPNILFFYCKIVKGVYHYFETGCNVKQSSTIKHFLVAVLQILSLFGKIG